MSRPSRGQRVGRRRHPEGREPCASHTPGPLPRRSINSDVSTSMSSSPAFRKNSSTSRIPYARTRISPFARPRRPPLDDG
ncbi:MULTISPECIES: hypothetical protein [unclassified Streptomyces]|uniref:hypothetical protein n=1 Tax=unclassified Streptomyces TaxID=2593676 RepID=UPI00307789C9